MWWNVTQGIFVGGGRRGDHRRPVLKKGTAAGAWAAFLTGSALSVAGIVVQQIEANLYHRSFFLNGTQIAFFSSLISIGLYIAVSLLTCREDFNLDRMLHRGPYAKMKEAVADNLTITRPEPGWARLIGIDGDFTRGDRWIAGLAFGYTLLLIAIFIVVSVWNIVAPWRTETWSAYFHVTGFALPIFFAVVTGLCSRGAACATCVRSLHACAATASTPLDDGTRRQQPEPRRGRDIPRILVAIRAAAETRQAPATHCPSRQKAPCRPPRQSGRPLTRTASGCQ